MKKILFLLLGITLLSLSSCFKLDNWDAPDCTFHGTVYDAYTREPILASQNDWQIWIWERSWTGHEDGATRQRELRIKQDGTYQNTKLFAGTYDMLLYNGPYWPEDTLKNVVLAKTTQQDFTVTPYLQIVDFDYRTAWNASKECYRMLIMFKVKVPRDEQGNVVLSKNGKALPQLRDVRAFLSLTTFCGAGDNSYINFGEYTADMRINNGKSWDDLLAEGNGTDTTGQFIINCNVKPNYTYYLRVGACVQDAYNKYNYSPIVKVEVPPAQ